MSDRGEKVPSTPSEYAAMDGVDVDDLPSRAEMEQRFTELIDSCCCEDDRLLVICPIHGDYARSLEDAVDRAAMRVLGWDVM